MHFCFWCKIQNYFETLNINVTHGGKIITEGNSTIKTDQLSVGQDIKGDFIVEMPISSVNVGEDLTVISRSTTVYSTGLIDGRGRGLSWKSETVTNTAGEGGSHGGMGNTLEVHSLLQLR